MFDGLIGPAIAEVLSRDPVGIAIVFAFLVLWIVKGSR